MRLSDISVKRPVTVVMVVLIILLLGLVSLTKLSIDLYPNMEIPVALVITNYSGTGPQEIESLITKPLEETLATVSNVEKISSTSTQGSSIVVLEFNFGTDMNFATLEMREKIDLIRDYLPDDADSPIVFKIDPNAFPIALYSINSEKGLEETQRIAENKIKSRLERIEGVASAAITGGFENEVRITVNPVKLQGYGLSLDQISNMLRAENLNLPGGQVTKGDRELSVRTIGEFKSVNEIANLPIILKNGSTITLKDVADVKIAPKELDVINKMNGKKSISLMVYKQSDSNTVRVAERVNKELEKLQGEIEGIEIFTIFDQSTFINGSIKNVARNGLVGGILAIFILYLFLRNIRSTLIISISIPVSIIATFSLIYFGGITLNLMTLGGMALGMGMLVDNSIVVLENIYRFKEEGLSRIEASKIGAGEVGMAVMASTLTTIAVFLPIVFVEGITSLLFKELALTVTFSLLASLIVSLTVVPMMASKILRIENNGRKRKVFDVFNKAFDIIDNAYRSILEKSIRHKAITICVAASIFILSVFAATTLGAEFMPKMDEGRISIDIELPVGAKLEETESYATRVENIIRKIPEIETVFISLGGDRSFMMGTSGQSNRATIDVILIDLDKRERSNKLVADEIRQKLSNIAGADISVKAIETQGMGPGFSSSPVSIAIKGDDLEILKQISNDFKGIVESVKGTREVTTSFEEGLPEIQLKIKRDVASKFGLNTYQIAQSVRNSVKGSVATKYKVSGSEIDVVVKVDDFVSENINNFKFLQIQTPFGTNIPLEMLADITISKGPNDISREDQVRTVTVTSDIVGRDLRSIVKEIEAKIENYYMPEGYSYKIGGENEELIESFKSLGLAIILAIILVYMVMASQFESLLHPFIIMFSVPLAFSGGIFGLFITGRTLCVPSIIGGVMLAGIVVNNAIVLVDYINILKNKGYDTIEAILKAGPTRLRPILMTTLTTVLGLLPLSLGIGEGAEAQAPLATVVIGGLILSTLLTLVLIPVMYLIFDRISVKVKKRLIKGNS